MIEKIRPYLPRSSAIAAILLLAFTIMYVIWQWREDWIIAHQPVTAVVVDMGDDVEELGPKLVEAHLFGQSPTGDAAILPVTSLPWRVTGIIKGTTNENSKVIISIDSQPGKIYHVGDSLPSGIIVNAVTKEDVILNNSGRLEKLSLPRQLPKKRGELSNNAINE